MKTKLSIFLALSIFVGCTQNHNVKTRIPADHTPINARALRQPATVTLVNGQELVVEKLRFSPDSTSWVDAGTRKVMVVPTTEVSNVRFVRTGKGARQGFTFGLLGGALTGTAIGLTSDNAIIGRGGMAVLGGSFLGGLGGLVGIPLGAMIGSKEVYHIEQNASQSVTEK